MLPIFAEALSSIALRVIQSILPQTPQDKLDVIRLQIQQQALDNELLKGQLQINQVEASNPNLWVSGARPAIMWICAAAFSWQFVILPILLFINAEFGYSILVPVFDTTSMISILTGMLGLGVMRSYDKSKTRN